MRQAPRAVPLLGAVLLGGLLAAVPFARYGCATPHPTAHIDHAPRHGGILGMVGDVHLEIVRRAGVIEVHPSDAHRRPVTAVGGRLELPGGVMVPLTWREGRLVGASTGSQAEVTCSVELTDGRTVRMTVEF